MRQGEGPHLLARKENRPEWKLILRELEFGPCTADDIAPAIRRHRETTKRYLKAMAEKKLIRVHGYERTRSNPNRIWCLWDGRQNAHFHAFTPALRARRIQAGIALPSPSHARPGRRKATGQQGQPVVY